MKKLLGITCAVLLFSLNTNAKNDIMKTSVELEDMEYFGCWEGADAAEIATCGQVRCNFELWQIVYDACMGDLPE